MDERQLVAGYRALLSVLYTDDAYYDRCELYLERTRIERSAVSDGALGAFARAVWTIGIRGRRRRRFWRLLARSLRLGLAAFPKAAVLAIVGEHLIRYTEEVVVPRLEAELVQMDEAARAAPSSRTRAVSDRPATPATRLV